MDKQDLLKLKDKINDTKTEVSELKGKKSLLMEELQTKWNCKTTKQTESKLKEMDEDIASLDAKIKKAIIYLEEHYELGD